MPDNEFIYSPDHRRKFDAGLISREDLWGSVNLSLAHLAQFSNLLNGNVDKITIHQNNNISIEYRLPNEINMKLLTPLNDVRNAGVASICSGNYEGKLESLIFAIARNSREFLDIGANLGFYSLGASLIKKDIIVHSFEPNPRIFEILLGNLKLNMVSNVRAHAVCLSDEISLGRFFVPRFTGSAGGSLKELHPEEGSAEELIVKVDYIDNIKSALNLAPDFIKIDVEGNELRVIRGALELINHLRPTIFIELLWKWMAPFDSSPQQVFDLLSEFGYVSLAVSETGLREIEGIDEEIMETNFVFYFPERKEHASVINGFRS